MPKTYEKASLIVDSITDRLGKKVDEGIQKAVTALVMHDFPTIQSCEGHLDHGLPYPWVDIAAPSANSELQETDRPEIRSFADVLHRELKTLGGKQWELYAELKQVSQKDAYNLRLTSDEHEVLEVPYNTEAEQTERHANYELSRRLVALLDQYYVHRAAPYHTMLTLEHMWRGSFRLQSIGTRSLNRLKGVVDAQQLQEYRDEMDVFADYLIKVKS